MNVRILVVGIAALLLGCSPERSHEEVVLDRAVGVWDMQHNPNQLAYVRTLKPGAKKPFGKLEIKADRTFYIGLFNPKPDGTALSSLARGAIAAKGNTVTFTANNINNKPVKVPKTLVYSLSDDGTLLLHADGTTFLKRSDPKKPAGNADLEAYLKAEQAKVAEAEKRRAEMEKAQKQGGAAGTGPPVTMPGADPNRLGKPDTEPRPRTKPDAKGGG